MRPAVTVGLVVRNGERYLAEAIESFLAQSFTDFALVVHDNASSDDTVQIAKGIAARDRRIEVRVNPRDLGPRGNFHAALAAADTPFFCWAACDDRRDERFLERLVALLEDAPGAGLAACAARRLDTRGRRREIMPETARLHDARGHSAPDRLVMHLADGACIPFYGLYRTPAAREQLGRLARLAAPDRPVPFRWDMVFVAAVLRGHGFRFTNAPLIEFRDGGIGHRIDQYPDLSTCVREVARFGGDLRDALHTPADRRRDRVRLDAAWASHLARFVSARPMRRMFEHYARASVPALAPTRAAVESRARRVFRRLRRRATGLQPGTRVVLLGGGKHTTRCRDTITSALAPHARLVGVCDDAPAADRIGDLPLIAPGGLPGLRPDLLLVSSDTFEDVLAERGRALSPRGVPVWCLYDPALETGVRAAASSR